MPYTLIISEKPDAARRISESIADKKPKVIKKNGADYYVFTVNGKKHVCVPAVGHLFVLNTKKDGKGWNYPVFEMEWIPTWTRKGTEWVEKYFKNIQALAKNAEEFIDAADVDNEGEVLLYNILRFICGREDAKRMKFSTLTKDELIESYRNMDDHIMKQMAEAGLTRHELDASWGFNMTRALTLALKSSESKGFTLLSTGRVQGPTLSLLMEREMEIRNFISVPFWQLELHVNIDNGNFVASFEEERIWDKKKADKILGNCKNKDAIVKDIRKRDYDQLPPAPFNTTELQSEAYSQFKFSPTQTLSIAESLYQSGYISYPRSSSQKLPPRIGYGKIIKALGKLSPYKKFAETLLKTNLKPIEGNGDDPAHPAVYATHEVPNLTELNSQQKKIYDLIARRTLAAFAEPATRETNTVTLDVNDYKFILVGKRTVKEGWMEIYSPFISRDEVIIPELEIGQVLKVIKLEMLSKKTEPSGRYSQGSIVKELEKRNLGTKSTRAEILQTLYDRGYISGKSIAVTKLGEAVVEALKNYCPRIVSEELTKHFEDEIEQVYNGEKERAKVVEEAKNVLAETLKEFRKNERDIGKKLLEGLIAAREEAGTLGPCPKCGSNLRTLRSKKGSLFVGCKGYPNCNNMYPLPGMAKIIPLGKLCEQCKTPMIQVIRRGRRPFRMCLDPNCSTKATWKKKLNRR